MTPKQRKFLFALQDDKKKGEIYKKPSNPMDSTDS